jgi:hypothetical protein
MVYCWCGITAWHRSNQTSRRSDALPGAGPVLATPSVASVGDPIRTQFLDLGRPGTKADLGVSDERRGCPRRWAE